MSNKSSRIRRNSASDIPETPTAELDRLTAMSDGEPDEENPEWSEQQINAAAQARRERILTDGGQARKRRITINLDEDLLAYFKALGAHGYQRRINEALRAYIAHQINNRGTPRDLIEQARTVLEQAERKLEQDDAA